jgi:hypothetical protein
MSAEMNCPICRSPMVTSDGREAICTQDGNRFKVLFSRHAAELEAPAAPRPRRAIPPPLPPARVGPPPLPGAQLPVAEVVDENTYDLSPEPVSPLAQLATAYHAPHTAGYGVAAGTVCRTHQQNAAVAYCRSCAAPICNTCDFAFPNGVHVCPHCVSRPPQRITPTRKAQLIWSYALAVAATVGIVITAIVAMGMASQEDVILLGLVVIALVLAPNMAGLGVSLCATDKRLGNPPVVWGAVIWNGILTLLIVGAHLLSMVNGEG